MASHAHRSVQDAKGQSFDQLYSSGITPIWSLSEEQLACCEQLPVCGAKDGFGSESQHCCQYCLELKSLRDSMQRMRDLLNEALAEDSVGDVIDAFVGNDSFSEEARRLDPDQQSQSVLSVEEAEARGIYMAE